MCHARASSGGGFKHGACGEGERIMCDVRDRSGVARYRHNPAVRKAAAAQRSAGEQAERIIRAGSPRFTLGRVTVIQSAPGAIASGATGSSPRASSVIAARKAAAALSQASYEKRPETARPAGVGSVLVAA